MHRFGLTQKIGSALEEGTILLPGPAILEILEDANNILQVPTPKYELINDLL